MKLASNGQRPLAGQKPRRQHLAPGAPTDSGLENRAANEYKRRARQAVPPEAGAWCADR
jgi:hypothetical protein